MNSSFDKMEESLLRDDFEFFVKQNIKEVV